MNSVPFFFDSFAEGSVAMSFKAFFLRDPDEAVLDFRCVDAGPTQALLEHAVFCQVGMRHFLCSPALREGIVSDTVSGLSYLGNTAVSLFWKDLLFLRCIEGALHCLLSSPGLRGWRWRGIRFLVEFFVQPTRSFHLTNYEMIDDVLIIGDSDSEEECSVRVEKPTRIKYSDSGLFREKECAICLEESTGEEDLGLMPCFHSFHYGCLSKWLATKPSCPLCRYQLATVVHPASDDYYL